MPLCAHCGAEVTPGINAACRDCGLSPDVEAAPSLPAPTGTAATADGNVPEAEAEAEAEAGAATATATATDEIVFDVSTWPAEQRVGFTGLLRGESVPWRWESGPVLVVRTFDEAVVEGLLEDAGIDDEEWQDTTGVAGDEEADAAAQTAMSDLFDAADRLVHNPASGDIVDELDGLAATIEESAPPYGIEAPAWEQMATLAAAVVTASEGGDDQAVEGAARSLRDFLRIYV